MKKGFYAALTAGLPLDKLRKAKILITGANGLIASSLAEMLYMISEKENLDVELYLLCRSEERGKARFKNLLGKNVHLLVQDVAEPLFTDVCFNFIVHAASSAHPDAFNTVPVDVMKANLFGTYNLLEYARKHKGCRFMFVSSSEIYGENFDGIELFHEDTLGKIDPAKFRSCYPESKRASETMCACYTKQYGTETVMVRPAYIFGKSVIDSNKRADVYFLRQALNKNDIVMYSKGEQVRSYCYVDDCVAGLLYVLLKGAGGEVYNIGNPDGTISMHDYAQKIADMGGVKLIYNPDTKPIGKTFLQTTKLILAVDKLESLGWKAQYSIDEGLKDIFESADN